MKCKNCGGNFEPTHGNQIHCCHKCCIQSVSRRYRNKNKQLHRDRSRKYHRQLKETAILHYGNRCTRCGITDMDVLTIDHLKGSGHKHRAILKKTGCKFYKWLIKNDFPEDYQVLCMNCNWKKFLDKCRNESKNIKNL